MRHRHPNHGPNRGSDPRGSEPVLLKHLSAITVAAFLAAVLIGAVLGTYGRSDAGPGMRAVGAAAVVQQEVGR